MKTLSYLFSLFLCLMLFCCQNNQSEIAPSSSAISEEKGWMDTVSEDITLAELPLTIKHEIHNDELFQELDISNITRITKDNFIYYDMTFKDVDGQLILVLYDETGEIIVP